MILSKDQFIGFYNIDFSDIADDFTAYAEQLEKQVLTDLFGKAMADDIIADPTKQEYVDLELVEILKNFFYFYYLRDRESYSATLGEFESAAQNATRAKLSRNRKIINMYNLGIKLYSEAANYVNDHKATYPLYDMTIQKEKTNAFGIEHNPESSGHGRIPCDHDDWFIRGCR